MTQPEASMVERYVKDECIGFVNEYLQRFNVVHKQVWDANEEHSEVDEALEGANKPYMLSFVLHDVAHK